MEEYLIEFAFYICIIAVVLLMLYFPKRAERKRRVQMLEKLKVGDIILTTAGLSGKIEKIETDFVIIKANPGEVNLQIEKWSILEINE